MGELLSLEWMQAYATTWNAKPDLAEVLAQIQFQSTIGYGFKKMTQPQGVLAIEQGRVISAGNFTGQLLSWDLRANLQDWEKWLANGLELAGLGLAYMSRKLVFKVGGFLHD